MKKGLLLLTLCFIFMCTGCDDYFSKHKTPLETGVWYAEKVTEVIDNPDASYGKDYVDSKLFYKAKYEIQEIKKEEYEQANGVNVCIDGSTVSKEEQRYMLFKLYLAPIGSETYILATITDLSYRSYAWYQYRGHICIDTEDIQFEGSCILFFSQKEINMFNEEHYFSMDFLPMEHDA